MTLIEQITSMDLISFLAGAGLVLLGMILATYINKRKYGKKEKTELPGFKRLVKDTNEYLLMANDNLLKLQKAFDALEEG